MSKNQILADIDESKSDDEENVDFQSLIDDLFTQACKQYSTYETMVIKSFSSSVDQNFDSDNKTHDEAFAYARKEYGYLTSSEIAEMDENNANDGICSHGLDYMTCPCGCFEGD